MPQILIKPFSPACQNGILDLIVGIQRNEFDIPITADDQPDLKNIPAFYQNGNGNFWVAVTENKEVIGTISLLDIGNGQAALRKMFVAPSYRGFQFNVARELLDALIEWAVKKGVREIYLGTTPKFLAAHRFYEKNEFAEIGKDSLPEAFPIMSVDTKFYMMSIMAP